MSTNAIIGIVVAIVVVGGGAWYLSAGSQGTMGEGMENTEEGGAGVSTFGALIAQGGSRTCTMTVTDEGMSAEGTIYVSDGKVRGDFTTTASGQTMTGHMIQADGYTYHWSDAMPQGMKMRINAEGSASSQSQTIDSDAEVDYDCSAWIADSGKFAVPSNVTFMELGASGAIPNMPSGMPAGY